MTTCMNLFGWSEFRTLQTLDQTVLTADQYDGVSLTSRGWGGGGLAAAGFSCDMNDKQHNPTVTHLMTLWSEEREIPRGGGDVESILGLVVHTAPLPIFKHSLNIQFYTRPSSITSFDCHSFPFLSK